MSVAFNPCAVNANKAILRGVGKSLVGRLSNGGENVSTRLVSVTVNSPLNLSATYVYEG